MKSVALIVWLLTPSGHEQIVMRSHFDEMPSCESAARAEVARHPPASGKTRYLCHAVVPENEDVDENGNPITHP